MYLRSRRARLSATLCLATIAMAAWLFWLRPVGERTGPTPAAIGDGWALSTPAAEGFDEASLLAATRRLLDRPLNVHSVLVERHGRLVAEFYQGGRDRSVYSVLPVRHKFGSMTLHDVRSVGKTVTSLLYGIALAERKVPDPGERLSAVFGHLDGAGAPNARRIRIRDLLDMSSGLAWTEGTPEVNDELRLFWKHDLPAYVLGRPMAAEPGTTFNYNGGGTALLAQIVADGTGLPIDRYAAERLFAPMGIRSWQWVEDMHGRPMAFNGLRLRPRDLLKFGRLVLDRGRWNARQLVPATWIADSWAPGRATGVANFTYRAQWWSGTVEWKGQRVAWHAGFGNGGQRLFVVPALDIAIVTTAGAYDELPTAIAVNRYAQDVVSTVRD